MLFGPEGLLFPVAAVPFASELCPCFIGGMKRAANTPPPKERHVSRTHSGFETPSRRHDGKRQTTPRALRRGVLATRREQILVTVLVGLTAVFLGLHLNGWVGMAADGFVNDPKRAVDLIVDIAEPVLLKLLNHRHRG